MKDLNTVFCHLHSHSQPRYPHFTLCPYCREDAPHEAIVVEAVVHYFSLKFRDFFIETELEIQMGTAKRRADIVLIDGKQNYAAIVECKRIGVQEDGIDQLKSYLCATATPLGIFANSTLSDDWEFFENLGRNEFRAITSDLFFKDIRDTPTEESLQPPIDAEAYYKRGKVNHNNSQYEDAITNYNQAIRLKPDCADAYYFRALMKVGLGQHTAAIADYDTAIRLKPDYTNAYYNRGNAKVKLGQYNEAIADYDIAIRLKPNYAEAYYERGNAKPLTKFGKGNLGRQNNAANTQALRDLSLSFPDQEQYATAIADFDMAIRLKPNYAEAYYARGNMKFKALSPTERDPKQYLAIIADFDNVIRLKPDDAIAYYDRGNTKMKLGQHAAAIADFDNVIRLKPDDATAYHVRGNAKVELEQYTAAIVDYDTAIRLKPDYAEAYDDRGHAKMLTGKTFAAIADAYKASRISKRKYGR